MLLKYSVSNFKSIGHNIEFSMFPLEDNQDERFLAEIDTVAGKWKILKKGVFFGPNASGKTSFIDSLYYVQNYVLEGPQSSTITKVNQFRGDIDELEGLTTFQFMIYVDKQVYTYGFSLDRSYVHEEWLALLDNNSFELLFERNTNEERVTSIEIYPKYARKNSKERNLAELLKASIKEKQAGQLFLKKLFENGSKKADAVYSWFKNIRIIYPESSFQNLPFIVQSNKDFRNFLSTNLRAMDTGVNDVLIASEKMSLSKFIKEYSVSDEELREIEDAQNGIAQLDGRYFIFETEKRDSITFVQIKFEHLLNGQSAKFNMEEESDGTQRIIDLLPLIFMADSISDTIFVVDELDRSLHTKLTKYLIKRFIQTSNNNQMLFTTHEVDLLDLELFRQEEIWFFEKKPSGETRLKPFSDFCITKGQDLLKDYLAGRFGAVPVIKEGK